jgi:pyridoxine 4-dehydrogenase
MTSPRLPASAAGTVTIGDFEVNRMGFGAMRITGRGIWGEPRDRDHAKAVLRRSVELGVNFFDTADSYGPEVSERLIAETLHPYEGIVIATKGGLVRGGPGRWKPDCSPAHLRSACEGSLARLRIETIDVYQLHTVDRKVPLEESIGTLKQLQDEGKIRHIGVSNFNERQLAAAQSIVSVVSVQNRYNIADRASDGVVDVCERGGLAFLPWRPLEAGELARSGGKYADLAQRAEATTGQVALAWLLHRSPVMLVIPGTGSVGHLEENVDAAGVRLDDEDLASLS